MANLEYYVNLRALLILALILVAPFLLEPDGWHYIGFFAACMVVLEMVPTPGWNRSIRKRNRTKLKEHSASHVSAAIMLVIITVVYLLFVNIPLINDQTVWVELAMLALTLHVATIAMDHYLARYVSRLERSQSEAAE